MRALRSCASRDKRLVDFATGAAEACEAGGGGLERPESGTTLMSRASFGTAWWPSFEGSPRE